MKKLTKKEIRATVNESLTNVVTSLEIPKPSRKTKKLIAKVSKKFSQELKGELKKQFKKMEKVSKPGINGKASQKSLSA
jgi:hypothetical protein